VIELVFVVLIILNDVLHDRDFFVRFASGFQVPLELRFFQKFLRLLLLGFHLVLDLFSQTVFSQMVF
jgi:hypothetical protein